MQNNLTTFFNKPNLPHIPLTINTIIMTSLVVAIELLLHKIENIKRKVVREKNDYGKNIDYGFILGISNIINFIFVLSWYKFFIY